MVGDGKAGELGAEHEANGSESESSPPSSRGRRALLAARLATSLAERPDGPHNGAGQVSGGARQALERDLHRYQAGSRQDRLSRKTQKKRLGASAGIGGRMSPVVESLSPEQLVTSPGRPGLMTDSQVWDDVGPGEAGTPQGDAPFEDGAVVGDDPPDNSLSDDEAEFGGELEGGAASKTDVKKKRRRSTRPSASSMATRLLLPVLAASWTERVAAFRARDGVPPKPYRPTSFAEAFELTAAERRALPKDQIRHLNTMASKIVAQALASVAFIDEWRDAIAQGPFNLRLIDLIDTLARALSHADAALSTAYEAVVSPELLEPGETTVLTPQQRLQRLLRFARAARRGLLSEVKRLIDRGFIPRGVLSGLKGRAGHLHAGVDVMALVNILEGAIAAGNHVTFTAKELERCTTIAYALIEDTSRAPTRRGGAARAAAIEERSRAYTLLWLAHREAHWALACIFQDRLDVRVVLPPLAG